jgi:hypothetical protein
VAELNKIWHTNPMAKSKVDLGKGFERIYFVLAALWIGIIFIYVFNNGLKDMTEVFQFIVAIGIVVPIYLFLKWICGGFKQ